MTLGSSDFIILKKQQQTKSESEKTFGVIRVFLPFPSVSFLFRHSSLHLSGCDASLKAFTHRMHFQLICTSVILVKLLTGHEYFNTEHKYHAAKKWPFYFCKVNFSKLSHCEQRHQPIWSVVQNERHSHLSPWSRHLHGQHHVCFEKNLTLWRTKHPSLLKTMQY